MGAIAVTMMETHLYGMVEEAYGAILESLHKPHRVPQHLQPQQHTVDLQSSLQHMQQCKCYTATLTDYREVIAYTVEPLKSMLRTQVRIFRTLHSDLMNSQKNIM